MPTLNEPSRRFSRLVQAGALEAEAPPSLRAKLLGDLTAGQVITLLRIRGGVMAGRTIDALIEIIPAERQQRPSPQDLCTLAMLGLIAVDRERAILTGKGAEWVARICD